MNPIETLKRDLALALPATKLELRHPRKADGTWLLDASLGDLQLAVQWSAQRGFGMTSLDESVGYGEGPHEIFFDDRKAITRRILELLESGRSTEPPKDVLLRELRSLAGFTQEQLASRLGVQQAAVSRLERRSDVTLNSLRKYAAAFGGQLEINLRTATGEQVPLLGSGARGAVRAAEQAAGAQSYRPAASRPSKSRTTSAAVNLLVLRVNDLERAKEFYELLGLHFSSEKHEKGPQHYSCSLEGMLLELYPCSKTAPRAPIRFGLRMPPKSKALDRLGTSKLSTEAPKLLRKQEHSSIYLVKDLDENSIELELTH